MPTIDPRLRPDLERAMPADDVPGGQYRADGNVRLVLFGDGEWHPVAVKAWRTDRHGRDVIDVGWHAEPGTWSGAYLANPEKMREGWTADRNADRNPGCGPGLSGVVQKAHYQRNDCPG